MPDNSTLVTYLDRAIRASLLLLALSAPVSIAATQISWSFAILFWLIRAFLVRPTLKKDAIDITVLAFVGLTLLSSLFSYEPEISLRKMVGVLLVTIVYLVSGYIPDRQMLRRMVAAVLVAAVVSVIYSLGLLAVGQNLKVRQLTAESALRAAGVQENDTILTAGGASVNSPQDLANAAANLAVNGKLKLHVYRYEFLLDYDLPVSSLSAADDPAGKFGIVDWSRGRDTRAHGFYGMYITYAEVLQLIASLAIGLVIMVPGGLITRNRIALFVTSAILCLGLFLTVTRASWAALAISAACMIVIGTSKKTVLICIALAIPVALAGTFYLQQKRNVAFIDTGDGSTTWRTTVWREGFNVLISDPRHLAVGIGMDSIKKHWQDWHMFDNGKLPMGHMHSMPLQLALERGVPTLIAWIVWIFIYLRMLWRGIRREDIEWPARGVLLGAFGGTIGFLLSGMVQYNLGDSEVAMVFYLVMGLSLAILRGGAAAPGTVDGLDRRSRNTGDVRPELSLAS